MDKDMQMQQRYEIIKKNLNDLWNPSFGDCFWCIPHDLLKSVWYQVTFEHFSIIDSVNGLARKTMLHIFQ